MLLQLLPVIMVTFSMRRLTIFPVPSRVPKNPILLIYGAVLFLVSIVIFWIAKPLPLMLPVKPKTGDTGVGSGKRVGVIIVLGSKEGKVTGSVTDIDSNGEISDD